MEMLTGRVNLSTKCFPGQQVLWFSLCLIGQAFRHQCDSDKLKSFFKSSFYWLKNHVCLRVDARFHHFIHFSRSRNKQHENFVYRNLLCPLTAIFSFFISFFQSFFSDLWRTKRNDTFYNNDVQNKSNYLIFFFFLFRVKHSIPSGSGSHGSVNNHLSLIILF